MHFRLFWGFVMRLPLLWRGAPVASARHRVAARAGTYIMPQLQIQSKA